MPHPMTLEDDAESEVLAAEATNLLSLTVPSPATAESAQFEPVSIPLSGGITVASSMGGETVYLSTTMTYSQGVEVLAGLRGISKLDVEPSGWHQTGLSFKITFPPEAYAVGAVPKLSIVSNDLNGALPGSCNAGV
jgi:hypothetical protein